LTIIVGHLDDKQSLVVLDNAWEAFF